MVSATTLQTEVGHRASRYIKTRSFCIFSDVFFASSVSQFWLPCNQAISLFAIFRYLLLFFWAMPVQALLNLEAVCFSYM